MTNREYILAFDTSTEHLSVAVVDRLGNTLSQFNELAFRHLSDKLHPAIEQCMTEAGITYSQLLAIACTKGPGSFTSVRVGLSAAKGLSFALQIPVVTFNTLEVLAKKIAESDNLETKLHIWVEAHGGNVYTTSFLHGEKQRDIESLPASLAAEKIKEGEMLAGSGVQKYSDAAPSHAQQIHQLYVQATTLAQMAFEALENNKPNVNDLKPLYIHPLHYHKTYKSDGTPLSKATS
ncbi:MAG: tRNA (adenosine(37)-N6)-threonylcarbamoyltransferase complex dimerization subunit type 1 TsaB [Pseudomonadota bacterium]|nr:tRNA (adenosine(37)-N6)-threonylcarbamoyltransferase complex dimerization subunit type 1 TsaB [Pseudomonadota bacterium]